MRVLQPLNKRHWARMVQEPGKKGRESVYWQAHGQALHEAGAAPGLLVTWDQKRDHPILYDPAAGSYAGELGDLALTGAFPVDTITGPLICRPAFDLVVERCQDYVPEKAEAICGVGREQIEAAARLLWEARTVSYYTWSGIEMQSNATQIMRAIGQLYALTGSFDARGGNVRFAAVPTNDAAKGGLPPLATRRQNLGLAERPLGPGRWLHVTSDELYRGIIEGDPYQVRGLVGFGTNLLLAHADGGRRRQALAELDFYVHADLFMNPTAELADIVLPITSAFESEALKIGFEISPAAQAHLQYRQQPGGIQLPLQTRTRKFSEQENGIARGFNTPSRKIELYSETMLDHGYEPLPAYEEPLVSPWTRPDLARRFPLILTCAKHPLFCETQHRALPSLRRKAMEPQVELHPQTAAERGIAVGDWVYIATPAGRVRARAKFDDRLHPRFVCGQHGWWQACAALDAPGYDPFSAAGANFNLIIGNEAIDPVSGSVPHRAYLCQVERVDAG